MSQIDYSFVQNDTGTFCFRSTTNSFGIENVTEKDITSFYVNFSKPAFLDTGLLPVDGTGMLAYRKADNHEQIVYQIKPGVYHVNWGSYEGDTSARTYFVAQPYRIVIADLLNGNLLGARTFYSPYPITSPSSILYHANLPNINCKGYRGNAVGWICLYHTHDISSMPFNEKVSHILERCSGVETYNDANMSETDGPRFYANHYSYEKAFFHLWDPEQWESYTSQNGYEWTLNPDIWIPVLVNGIDDQAHHSLDGINLDVQMALLGNYQAYYTDTLIPKPVNAILRNDPTYSQDNILSLFTKVYLNSSNVGFHNISDPYTLTLEHRNNLQTLTNDETIFSCYYCELEFDEDFNYYVPPDNSDVKMCENCFCENYVYVESVSEFFNYNNSNIFYDNHLDDWFHSEHIPDNCTISCCNNCKNKYIVSSKDGIIDSSVFYSPIDPDNHDTPFVCSFCFHFENEYKCSFCNRFVPNWNDYLVNHFNDDYFCNHCWSSAPSFMKISTVETNYTCACGESHPLKNFKLLNYDDYTFRHTESLIPNANYSYSFTEFDLKSFDLQENGTYTYSSHEIYNCLAKSLFPSSYDDLINSHSSLLIKIYYVCPSCYEHIGSIISHSKTVSLITYLFFKSQIETFNKSNEDFVNFLANSNITFSIAQNSTF